jgi:simple sugar transport system substrate-binding protein
MEVRMKGKVLIVLALLAVCGALLIAPAAAQDNPFVFGVVLVGPKNDRGWSQAHYEAGQYVEKNVPGSKMLVFERLNSADSPETTLADVVKQMVEQGAKLILTTSDDFQTDTLKVSQDPAYKDITFVNVSGDDAYTGKAPANLSNFMGQMEWAKMIAGCAAALTTQTNSIGYLGPLINFETRRLASSAYLGARYCFEKYRDGKASDLKFNVTWIGFWFNIPGVTLDPTEESKAFIDKGSDVLISGLDTTEAIDVAAQQAKEGKKVWAVPYDYRGACDQGPEVCLGVPYFNWGPEYVKVVKAVQDGSWKQTWEWVGPDWTDINNPDTSAVGFEAGQALSADNKAHLDEFIKDMAAYAGDEANKDTFWLWQGPLKYQDGTEIAKEGETLPGIAKQGEAPSVWYLDQLLDGMTGTSTPEKK